MGPRCQGDMEHAPCCGAQRPGLRAVARFGGRCGTMALESLAGGLCGMPWCWRCPHRWQRSGQADIGFVGVVWMLRSAAFGAAFMFIVALVANSGLGNRQRLTCRWELKPCGGGQLKLLQRVIQGGASQLGCMQVHACSCLRSMVQVLQLCCLSDHLTHSAFEAKAGSASVAVQHNYALC